MHGKGTTRLMFVDLVFLVMEQNLAQYIKQENKKQVVMVEDREDFPLIFVFSSTSVVLRSPQGSSMWDFQNSLAYNLINPGPEDLCLCQH